MAIRIHLLTITGYMLDGARAVSQVFKCLPRANVGNGGDFDEDRVVEAWEDIDKAREWIGYYRGEWERFYGSALLPSTENGEDKPFDAYLPKARSIEKLGGVIEFTTPPKGRLVRCYPSAGRAAVFQVYFGEQGSLREAGRLMAQVGENDRLRILNLSLTPEGP